MATIFLCAAGVMASFGPGHCVCAADAAATVAAAAELSRPEPVSAELADVVAVSLHALRIMARLVADAARSRRRTVGLAIMCCPPKTNGGVGGFRVMASGSKP